MTQRTVQGATRKYLVLEYAKGDRLYLLVNVQFLSDL
jgi:transcription-repair coupling factor (superfamily II helicase)